MNHPAELALHQYMENAVKGDSTISEDTIKQVANDVADAMLVQQDDSLCCILIV